MAEKERGEGREICSRRKGKEGMLCIEVDRYLKNKRLGMKRDKRRSEAKRWGKTCKKREAEHQLCSSSGNRIGGEGCGGAE
jgi:hypothetical protein